MHAYRRAVHHRVERLPAQSATVDGFAAGSARECAGLAPAPRPDRHVRPLARQREGCRSRRTSRTDQQNAARPERHAALDGAQDSNVICIVPTEPAAAHDDRIYRSDGGGERLALIEIAEDALLVRQCDAESGDTEAPHSRDEITQAARIAARKFLNVEGQINRIEAAHGKTGIVQERRKRMRDGIADHAVDARAARWAEYALSRRTPGISAGAIGTEGAVQTIHVLYGVKRELPGRRGLLDGRVRQRGARAQCEDAGRGGVFTRGFSAHRHRDDIVVSPHKRQQTVGVRKRIAYSRDLYGVRATVEKTPQQIRQARRQTAKVMGRNQQPRRSQRRAQFAWTELLRGFNLDIAPETARTHRLRQNFNFLFHAAGEFAAARTGAAGGYDRWQASLRQHLRQHGTRNTFGRLVRQLIRASIGSLACYIPENPPQKLG